MTEIDDKALNAFFKDEKKEIEDNGFSRRVMNSLPNKENKLSTIWISFCSIISILLFFMFDGCEAVLKLLHAGFNGAMKQGLEHIEPSTLLIAFMVIIGLGIKETCFTNK